MITNLDIRPHLHTGDAKVYSDSIHIATIRTIRPHIIRITLRNAALGTLPDFPNKATAARFLSDNLPAILAAIAHADTHGHDAIAAQDDYIASQLHG